MKVVGNTCVFLGGVAAVCQILGVWSQRPEPHEACVRGQCSQQV